MHINYRMLSTTLIMAAVISVTGFHGISSPAFALQDSIEVTTIYESESLSGFVVDLIGKPLEDVQIIETSKNWKERLLSTDTDATGYFQFDRSIRSGKLHYLEMRKPGYKTLLIRINIDSRAKKAPRFQMAPGV